MDPILQQISNQENFSLFIEDNMKLSTYVPRWKQEIPESEVEYSPTKNFSTYTATYEAAMIASVIDAYSDKPLKDRPTLGQLTGTIARMGDRFQLNNMRLEKLMEMENRYRDTRRINLTETSKLSEWMNMIKFLFNDYENSAIAPHKRLDMLYFEGISNGSLSITLANNPDGVHYAPIDLGVTKFNVSVPWNAANTATMAGLADIRKVVNALDAEGKTVLKMRMTAATFQKLQASKEFNENIKMTIGTLEMNPVGQLPLGRVNQILGGLDLPPIQLEKVIVKQLDGSNINAFQDDRIVFQCAPTLAKMIVSDPLELMDPHPNKYYTSYFDNLISSYRTETGRFVEYEMWALPVFAGVKDYAILETDKTA